MNIYTIYYGHLEEELHLTLYDPYERNLAQVDILHKVLPRHRNWSDMTPLQRAQAIESYLVAGLDFKVVEEIDFHV